MAEIKVEKNAGGNKALWLLAALVIAGVLAALLFTNMGREERTAAGLYDPSAPVSAVTYQGERWAVQGQVVDYPEEQMTQVGTSPEGYRLFANTEQGYTGGGGGGEITPETDPQAFGRVFLKTVDGRYQPLFKLE